MLNSRINVLLLKKKLIERENKNFLSHSARASMFFHILNKEKEKKGTFSHAELSHQCYLNTEQRKREKSSCHIQLSHKCSFIY